MRQFQGDPSLAADDLHISTAGRGVEVEGDMRVGHDVGDAPGAGLAEDDDPLGDFAALVEKPDRRGLRYAAIHGGHPYDTVVAQSLENAGT